MFKSSRSPSLSLQKKKQLPIWEKRGQRDRTQIQPGFFSWPGKKRHLWSECAWGSTVRFHFRTTWQTNTDGFVHLFFFPLLFSLTLFLKLGENTHHKYISVLVGFVCSAAAVIRTYVPTLRHTRSNKSALNDANNRVEIIAENWGGKKLFRLNSLIPLMAS